ncbi:sodium channel protein Nach-like [Nylanderia fulva]|uniref:sodium channel protein Nach-like n=1 Tax=Nylanderia fulva TaxID=613905 RepID=UPI0010FB8786|nr:sodium channel protein Nach-like [Nylanderia fulva]
MMLNDFRKKRHAVNRIIVDQMEISKKTNNELFDRYIKSYRDQPRENTKQIARELLQEYLYDSSLHGVKYLGKLRIKSTTLGKVFWTLIMIGSFLFLSWMFWKTWIRYSTNPTRTIIESFHSPVALVPFPAITVCPLVVPPIARRLKVLKDLKLPPNMNNETVMFLLKYGVLFTNNHITAGRRYLNDLQALLNANDLTIVKFLQLMRPCEDFFESCWWEGVETNCSELFKFSYTFSGVCCSFNYLLQDDIRTGRTTQDSDLLKSMLFGPRANLIAVIRKDLMNLTEDNKSIRFATNSVGLLIFPHHPLEYIGPIATREILQINQELRVSVIPFTKREIGEYYYRNSHGKLVPHCADEKTNKLKYFPTYRYSNCFTVCSIDAIYETCDCLPYYYTPIAEKYSLRICNFQDFDCLSMIKRNFTCECVNPCWNVYYEVRSSSLLLNNSHDFNIIPMYRKLTDTQSVLRVFYNGDVFTQTNTIPIADELYLLASIGGIFSLFLGASFISAVEIFYFFELFFRSYYNSKKSK